MRVEEKCMQGLAGRPEGERELGRSRRVRIILKRILEK